MQFNPKALLPLAICLAVMMVVFTIRQSSVDRAVDIAGWGILGAMSVVALWKMARRRRLIPYSQADSMPERVRRWIQGEPADHQQSRVPPERRDADEREQRRSK